MKVRSVAVAIISIVTLTGTGCSRIIEKVGEKACQEAQKQQGSSTTECKVEVNDSGVKINAGGDNLSVGNTDFPDGYPDYLKPDGLKPLAVVSHNDESTLTYETKNGTESADALTAKATEGGCTKVADAAITTYECPDGKVTFVASKGEGSKGVLMVHISKSQG